MFLKRNNPQTQNLEDVEPGAWPKIAWDGSRKLVFGENFIPENLNRALMALRVQNWVSFIFFTAGAAGLVFLGFYTWQLENILWVKMFLASLLSFLILWTRLLARDSLGSKVSQAVDVKNYFSFRALGQFRRALLARGNYQANGVHLLLELLRDKSVQFIFLRLEIDYRELAKSLTVLAQRIPAAPPAVSEEFADIPFLANAARVDLGARQITPLVLLAGLSRLPEDSLVCQLWDEYGIESEHIYQAVRWQTTLARIRARVSAHHRFAVLKPKSEINRSLTSLPTHVLDNFSTDLTLRARMGKLPIVVGREEELNKILSAFKSGTSNVLLVGEAGVGKTSFIELLAQRMLSEDVPPRLYDKRLVRLELAQIIGEGDNAGHALTAAINDALRAGNIVLAVENIHEFAQSQSSGVPLLSILSSAVEEHDLPIVATTTPRDYEQTPFLQSNRIFERVDVGEVGYNDAVLMASIQASVLENRFNVFWTFEAVARAVVLSSRYIQGARQPEKAIKVLTLLSERKSPGKKKTTEVIKAQDVEKIISEIAHVDAESVTEEQADKLIHLEDKLHERIIGQDEAVRAVAGAMRRVKANLSGNQQRPLGTFLFVGPTGVGKTELAKALAAVEFGSDEAMIRLDMSEYNLPESVEKLLGGRTYTSSFAAAVRERPYSVILLDEFEKSHLEVQNLFLQVFDEGYLTDNAGNKFDLTNSIIIATSNAAADEIRQGFEAGVEHKNLQEKLIHEILVKYFRPELLNRFDGIILFKPLSIEEMGEIVKLQLQKTAHNLSEQGINFVADEAGIQKIAKAAYDQTFGARPLRRYLQENVENKIAEHILARRVHRRDTVVITAEAEVSVQKAEPLA